MKRCDKCGGDFVWEQLPSGKWMPTDPSGRPHWMSCERKPRKRRQKPKPNNMATAARLNMEADKRLELMLDLLDA